MSKFLKLHGINISGASSMHCFQQIFVLNFSQWSVREAATWLYSSNVEGCQRDGDTVSGLRAFCSETYRIGADDLVARPRNACCSADVT